MRKLLVVFVIIFCCIAAGVIIDHSVLAESEKKRSTKENSNKTDSITVKMSEEKWKEIQKQVVGTSLNGATAASLEEIRSNANI